MIGEGFEAPLSFVRGACAENVARVLDQIFQTLRVGRVKLRAQHRVRPPQILCDRLARRLVDLPTERC